AQLPADAARLKQKLELRERVAGATELGRPAGDEDKNTPRGDSVRQVGEEIDGRGVRPVQVIDKEHEPLLGRELLQQRRRLAGRARQIAFVRGAQALERFQDGVIRFYRRDVVRAPAAQDARRIPRLSLEEKLLRQRRLAGTGSAGE